VLAALPEAAGAVESRGLRIPQRQYTLAIMWTILEQRGAANALDKLPRPAAEKYTLWCAIVRQSGPHGLRAIKSFHDEKLAGKLAGLRSSRLSLQWRVLYRVRADVVTVEVERVTPHDYRP